jgi:hypothetical protein
MIHTDQQRLQRLLRTRHASHQTQSKRATETGASTRSKQWS